MTDEREKLSYKDFPALAAYVDRIKAECRNFFRYMVVDYKANGYYQEKCYIRLNMDGTIGCTDKTYAPTKEEAKDIEEEMAIRVNDLPHSVNATEALMDRLRSIAGFERTSYLYEFYDRKANPKEGNIIMVQQRVQEPGADKYFLNWSFWSDGLWRKMEPDVMLPFWKPKVQEETQKIMIHEGAKTARMLTELKQMPGELAEHPFGHILSQYEHWGMIGGALVPHRSNYEELVHAKPTEVMYVCDNDIPGKQALQKVSEHYGRSLLGVMWDDRWPHKFDLGDNIKEVRKEWYTAEGRYVGPQFEEFITFATFATKLIPNDAGKGRPITVLSENFTAEWYHCAQPEVFIHRKWPSLILTANEFNNHVRPFSHTDDTARLVKKDRASKSAILSYQPGREAGIYSDLDGTYINTHIGSLVKPEHGDVSPFLDFMEHLVPFKADRHELMRWCATLIARPDIKMLYGVLLISETQGIGKGTLGERVLAPLIGNQNVSYPSETEIVDGNYNYWSAHKRLAVVHEIYAGHSAKAYNKLKSIITDKNLTVMKKYQANYIIENWVHVLACSNSLRALQLSMDDRRWLVPKLTERKKDSAYWGGFNRWLLEGGLSHIKQWAIEFCEANAPVMRGEDAPMTRAKKEMVVEGYSPGMEAVAMLLDLVKTKVQTDEKFRDMLEKRGQLKDGRVAIVDKDLVEYIKLKLYDGRPTDRIEKPATLRKVAKGSGWAVGEHKIWHFRWGQDRRGGRLIALDASDIRPEDLADLSPLDVNALEAM